MKFRKGLSKEQKREVNRQREIIREKLYPVLLGCENVWQMKRRVEGAYEAIKQVFNDKKIAFDNELKKQTLAEWGVKPLPGKGEDIEQLILDVFKDEKMEVVDRLLQEWPIAFDSFVKEELIERKPDTLKVKLL